MQLRLINCLLGFIILCAGFFLLSPSVEAGFIPDKSICIQNDKGQPLLFNGQGLWTRQNNVLGTFWYRKGGADGCTTFTPDEKTGYTVIASDATAVASIKASYQTNASWVVTNPNDKSRDMGCGSGPYGFKVLLPPDWEKDWECQTVGNTEGKFPCCKNEEERAKGKCNMCNVHDAGYQGQYQEKQCYCDRSANNNQADSECPICFHNTGELVTVTLKCKQKKTTTAKQLDKPDASKFSSKANVGLSCLTTEICSDTDPLKKCKTSASATSGTRRVRLVGVKQRKQTLLPAQPTKPFWVVECVMEGASQQNAKYKCTTGNSANDMKAVGVDNFTYLKNTYGYSSSVYKQDGTALTQPFLSDEVLLDTYEWETTTSKLTSSVFMGVYDGAAIGAASIGSNPGQQLATLSFPDSCTLIQDPFGHVFDSYTLEPLVNASVEISKKNDKGTYEPLNKQQTSEDGSYSFYVSDGSYKITAAQENYIFPGKGVNLNAQANMFYSNLYHGEEIIQEGQPVQKDIPLDPVNLQQSEEYAKANPIKIMNYFQTINKANKTYVIEGKVTHPRALVVVYANIPDRNKTGKLIRGRALQRTEADNSGYFKLIFPLSSLKDTEVVGELETVKKNRTKDSIVLNPLFDSMKGYAYDETGRLIPGAIVEVMTNVSTKPYFTTQADAKGFFSISSQNLPPLEMSLQFVSLNKTVDSTSTRAFIAQNSSQLSGSTLAKNGDTNGSVLGISDIGAPGSPEGNKTILWFAGAIVLILIAGAVYKIYLR